MLATERQLGSYALAHSQGGCWSIALQSPPTPSRSSSWLDTWPARVLSPFVVIGFSSARRSPRSLHGTRQRGALSVRRSALFLGQEQPTLNWNCMDWVCLSENSASPSVHLESQSKLRTLPVMPIDYGVHLPSQNHKLVIGEHRYQSMYDDIILSGSRRFVVTWNRGNRLAKVGVVFHLDDLKVSVQADGTTRYVAQHSACERARIVSLEDPLALESESQYLRAKVEFLDSCDVSLPAAVAAEQSSSHLTGSGITNEEKRAFNGLRHQLNRVTALMHELNMKPRFGNTELHSHSFWNLCGTYGSLLALRLQRQVQQNRLEAMQSAKPWLRAHMQDSAAFRHGDLSVLPESIRLKFECADKIFEEGLQKLQYVFQYLLQSCDFRERVCLVAGLLHGEWRALLAQKSLQGIVGGSESEGEQASS